MADLLKKSKRVANAECEEDLPEEEHSGACPSSEAEQTDSEGGEGRLLSPTQGEEHGQDGAEIYPCA